MLEIAIVRATILVKQDDDYTNLEIRNDDSEVPGESTLSSNIEEDDLNNRQGVLHLDQARRDTTLWMTSVPLLKKWSHDDTIIALTSLPNLRQPAGAIALQLLKRQMSAINILCESDIVPAQVLPLPKAGGDQSVLQPKACGDYNVPQHKKADFEVAKWFMEAIAFKQTAWPIIPDEKNSMVDEAWQLAIESQDHLRALAGAPVGTPSV